MNSSRKEATGPVSVEALLREARAFGDAEGPYRDYVAKARAALLKNLEARVGADGHDVLVGLMNQFKGQLARFNEVDAICQSLLLQMETLDPADGERPRLLEELMAGMNALVGIELEARAAQMRLALAAAMRGYLDGHAVQTRTLKIQVEQGLARRFTSLNRTVRDRQARLFGRHDSVGPDDLLGRLVALGDANPDLLAQMGTPLFPNTQGGPA